MTLDAIDHLLPRLGPRQLQHPLGPDACTTISGTLATGRASSLRAGSTSSSWSAALRSVSLFYDPLVKATGYNPNGLNIITSGISIQRPPRSNIFLGYTIIDTGPIKTSALNASISYWLSPKWYGTFSESYDFGDGGQPGYDVLVHPDRGRLPHDASDSPGTRSVIISSSVSR